MSLSSAVDILARMANSIITTDGLTKSFGTVKAVKGVDLAVEEGTVFGLLGPNGAGKTTTIRILTTLLQPDEGKATVAGFDVVRDAARLRPVIGLAGQFAAVDENLTGLENLEMVGRLYHLPRAEARKRAEEVLERFELADAAHRTAKTYSGGMRRRLDVGASLVGRPKVLFMDEPTTGLDPRSRLVLWELIRDLQKGGTTLLLCTQYLEEADHLCDRIAVIDLGTVIAEGTSTSSRTRSAARCWSCTSRPSTFPRAADSLRGLGAGETSADQGTRLIRVPVGSEGPTVLLETVRRLDDAGIPIEDIALHRPTLDDVFLSLTGHAAEMALEEEAAEAGTSREEAQEEEGPMSADRGSASPGSGSRAVMSVQDSLVVARRNLMQIVRIPAVLVFELVQPVMFVLLFVYVFAGNIRTCRPRSRRSAATCMFLMPGIIVQNAIFGATTTAIGIAEDLKAGFVDRFRSLPMARSAMLAGRATSDLIKNFILLLVVIGIGYLVGFSFENGFLNAIWMIVLVHGGQLHVLVGDGLDRAVGEEAGGGPGGRVHGDLPARVHELGPRAGRGDGPWVQVIARNNPITHWANLARYFAIGRVPDDGRLGRAADRARPPSGSSGSSRSSCRSRSGCTRS